MDKPIETSESRAIVQPDELSPEEMQHVAGGQNGTARGDAW